jgi:hypothetical protein
MIHYSSSLNSIFKMYAYVYALVNVSEFICKRPFKFYIPHADIGISLNVFISNPNPITDELT